MAWRSPIPQRWPLAGRVLAWTGIAFVVLVGVLVLTLALMDWNALRGPIARMASAKTGKPIRIDGDLEVHALSLTPRIIVNGLKVGNPKWAGSGSLAEVSRISTEVKLLPLFAGRIIMPRLRIERPVVNLLATEDGRANWATARTGKPEAGVAPRLPVIQRFEMDTARVSYLDHQRKLEFNGTASANETTGSGESQPFRLEGSGKLNDKPFSLQVRGAPLLNVRWNQPYGFDAHVSAGPTKVIAHGAITRAFDLSSVKADVEIEGDDLSELYYLTGLALPNTPPYKVTGNVARKGSRVDFTNVSGKVGDSDMSGDVSIELGRERPLVVADIASKSLDLDDIATWFGAPPSAKKGETASPQQKVADEKMAAQRQLFPDAKLKVERVRAMDARVKYVATAIRSGRFPLRTLSINLTLDNGVLTADPVAFTMPQGKMAGAVKLDASKDVPKTDVDLRISGIQLEQFKPKNSTQSPLVGVLAGRVKLHGTGDSVHEFVSTSDGNVTFVVPHGEVREAFAELTGINVARGLGLLVTKDQEKANVRCGVADMTAKNGQLQMQNLVFDTDNVLITGKGDVSLTMEEFDVSIRGQPKKLRFFRVRSPIAIRGPLRKPSIGIEGEKAVAQGGVAAALGVLVAPLAAVVAFVDPGLAKDANCSALLAEAKSDGAPVKTAEINKSEQSR